MDVPEYTDTMYATYLLNASFLILKTLFAMKMRIYLNIVNSISYKNKMFVSYLTLYCVGYHVSGHTHVF
jgi:hypothetical protein